MEKEDGDGVHLENIKSKIKDNKIRFLNQIKVVLETMTEQYENRVPFTDFEVEYKKLTNATFMAKFEKLEKVMENWELADVFKDICDEFFSYRLFEDVQGVKFIVASQVEFPENDDGKNVFVKKEIRNKKAMCRAQAGVVRLDRNTWEETHQELVVFSEPTWPFLSDALKKKNQNNYKKYVIERLSDSWKLTEMAYDWWYDQVKKYSQVLYFLNLLNQNCAKGHFMLTQLDRELLKVFPKEWVRNYVDPQVNYNSFGISKSKLVELNLIVRFDVKDPAKFCVNRIIQHLHFQTINDEIPSLMYDFMDRRNYVTMEDIDDMLMDCLDDWKLESRVKKQNIIRAVLGNQRLFSLDRIRNDATNVRPRDQIFVPMYFHYG